MSPFTTENVPPQHAPNRPEVVDVRQLEDLSSLVVPRDHFDPVETVEIRLLHAIYREVEQDVEGSSGDEFSLRAYQRKVKQWATGARAKLEEHLSHSAESLRSCAQEIAIPIIDAAMYLWRADHQWDSTLYCRVADYSRHELLQQGLREYIAAHDPVSQWVTPPGTEESEQLRKLKIAFNLLDPWNSESRALQDKTVFISTDRYNEAGRTVASLLTGENREVFFGGQMPFVYQVEGLKTEVSTMSMFFDQAGLQVDVALSASPFLYEPLHDLESKLDLQGQRRVVESRQQISVLASRVTQYDSPIRPLPEGERLSIQWRQLIPSDAVREALAASGIAELSPPGATSNINGRQVLRQTGIRSEWLKQALRMF